MKEGKRIPGVGVTRRAFIGSAFAAAGLVATGAANEAQRGSADRRSDGEILKKKLKRCPSCDRLRGQVQEKWNGQVPVLCRCDLRVRAKTRSPAMVSLKDDSLMWMPITNYKGADGRWWHVPYFVGFRYR